MGDLHVVCGCLKDFLRSLKEPLVTHELWQSFVGASGQRLHNHYKSLLDTLCVVYANLIISRYYDPTQGALSDDAVQRLASVRPAGMAPRSASLAKGCHCTLPLQAWAGAYCGGLLLSLLVLICAASSVCKYCTRGCHYLLLCWLGDMKGIQAIESRVLFCWW